MIWRLSNPSTHHRNKLEYSFSTDDSAWIGTSSLMRHPPPFSFRFLRPVYMSETDMKTDVQIWDGLRDWHSHHFIRFFKIACQTVTSQAWDKKELLHDPMCMLLLKGEANQHSLRLFHAYCIPFNTHWWLDNEICPIAAVYTFCSLLSSQAAVSFWKYVFFQLNSITDYTCAQSAALLLQAVNKHNIS